MSKTLQKLLMEELHTDNADQAEALADVVLDWMERIERNGEVNLASGWRPRIEDLRQQENQSGQGR